MKTLSWKLEMGTGAAKARKRGQWQDKTTYTHGLTARQWLRTKA